MPNPSQPPLPMPLPGSLVGPWRLLEYVGEGSYGLVYRCTLDAEPHAGPYALKWARSFNDERFEREAELLSRIHHASWRRPWSGWPRAWARGQDCPSNPSQGVRGGRRTAVQGLVLRAGDAHQASLLPQSRDHSLNHRARVL